MSGAERSMEQVREEIRDLLVTILELEAAMITPAAQLVTELGADSFGAVEIMARLEATFDIVIQPEDAVEMGSLQSITDLVMRLLEPS